MENLGRITQRVIDYNVKRLKIKRPQIVYRPPEIFATETTQAACSTDGEAIAINEKYKEQWESDILDCWFFLSHEIRHCWQMQKQRKKFGTYKTSAVLNMEEYNAQELEVDAWAWTLVVMRDVFKARPQIENIFSKELIEKINQRMKEIKE